MRIGHIKEKNNVRPCLARVFVACRRAILRGLGLPKKAMELPLGLLGEATDGGLGL